MTVAVVGGGGGRVYPKSEVVNVFSVSGVSDLIDMIIYESFNCSDFCALPGPFIPILITISLM